MNLLFSVLRNPYILLAVRIIVAMVFILAAVGKIADPDEFAKSIERYQMMPMSIINTMALVLPWLELITGCFLLFGSRIKANSALISSMLVMFIIAILSAMSRGLDINCGCTSSGGSTVGWEKILEDLLLLGLALWLYFFPQTRISLDFFSSQDSQ